MDRIATVTKGRFDMTDVELKKEILTLVLHARKEYVNLGPNQILDECKKYFDFITSEEKKEESPYSKHKTS